MTHHYYGGEASQQPQQYQLGQVVNGHVLTHSGWVPVAAPQPQYAAQPQYAPQPQVVVQQNVIGGRTRTSHTFHLIMTIITVAMWAPVWMIVTLTNRGK